MSAWLVFWLDMQLTLQWCHNEYDGVSNHRRLERLPNRLLSPRSKKTSKIRVSGLCEGHPPMTGKSPTQRASNAEYSSIRWSHHSLQNFIDSNTSVLENFRGVLLYKNSSINQQWFIACSYHWAIIKTTITWSTNIHTRPWTDLTLWSLRHVNEILDM